MRTSGFVLTVYVRVDLYLRCFILIDHLLFNHDSIVDLDFHFESMKTKYRTHDTVEVTRIESQNLTGNACDECSGFGKFPSVIRQ